jgi:hypothetical protein
MYMQKAGPGLPDITEPVVPLFAGETVGLLAWVDYLLGPSLDAVSPLVRPRIHRESEQRVLIPCLDRDDFWWMGFGRRSVNNWNPWVNSNWLTAILAFENDFDRRVAAVAKVLRSLDNFIDPYPKDGGCDEGPGYWGRAGASLFDCLELLHAATGGAVDVYAEPLIQEIGRYIYRVQIADRWFVNFADAPALVVPVPFIVHRYGERIGDKVMKAFGAWSAAVHDIAGKGVSDSLGRQLPALFGLEGLLSESPRQPLPRDVWFPEIQVLIARDREGSSKGLFLAAKGGHNAESHNHNDVGHFIVYVDGRPLLVDAGVETYTRKTFSPERYDIWTMQSGFHNLPSVNGRDQVQGRERAARDVRYAADDRRASLTLDIAGAYPDEAGIDRWVRTVSLERGHAVTIADDFALRGPSGSVRHHFITPSLVEVSPGKVRLRSQPLGDDRATASGLLSFDAAAFDAAVEPVPIDDPRLRTVWGERLFRILLTSKGSSPAAATRFSVEAA